MGTYAPDNSLNYVPSLTLAANASTNSTGRLTGKGLGPLTTIPNTRQPRSTGRRSPYATTSSITSVPSTASPTWPTTSERDFNHLPTTQDLAKTVENAYRILQQHNLVSDPLPAVPRVQQSVAAEETTLVLTFDNVAGVRRSFELPSVYAQRSRSIYSLSLSLDMPRDARIDEHMLLENIMAILRSLPALKELSITGQNKSHIVVWDIFQGCTFRLEKLHCTVDKLLAASWKSLQQHYIRDFRGFMDVAKGPPSDVRPWGMVSLTHLETSACFAERLTNPAQITHLSLHTNRSMTRPTLRHLSNLLGDKLVSLRVNRTLAVSRSPSVEEMKITDAEKLLWASDSPLMICCMLRAPKMTYLEVRDTSLKKWSVNAHSVRDVPGVPTMVGTPALQRLVWRPAWATRVRQLHCITTEHIRDCFALLPVNYIAIPVESSDLGDWRVSLRGQCAEEFEEHWPFCAIREDSWRI